MPDKFLHGVEVIELDGGARPIKTAASSVIGLVGTAPKGPINTPTLILGSRQQAVELFGPDTPGFTIPAALDAIFAQTGAMVVVIRVAGIEKADPTKITAGDIIGMIDPASNLPTGCQALLSAQSEVKVQPRILIAPGFTHQMPDGDANPVLAELVGIAERLRAVVIADCPDVNETEAINYREAWGSARVYCAYPWVKVYDAATDSNRIDPPSARIAGMIAKSDNERGFWWSPSNTLVNGIVGISKPIDFALGEPNCKANFLNEHEVATFIQESGFRLWGNRTTSADPKWAFLSVRRTADMINDSLLRAHLWAVDRNITKTYVEDVVEGVNAYLRYLKNIGAILGGQCWADPELNSPDQVEQGKVTFDFDFTPPYPAEHITFRSRMVNGYLTEIFK